MFRISIWANSTLLISLSNLFLNSDLSIYLAVFVDSPLLALLPNSRLGRSRLWPGHKALLRAQHTTSLGSVFHLLCGLMRAYMCVFFQLHNTPIQLFQVPRNWRCSQRLILTSKKWLTAKIFTKKVGVAVSCCDFDLSVCKATHCTEQISKWLSCSSVQFPGNYVLRKSDKIERKIESVSRMLRLKPKPMCQVWFLETFKLAFNLPFSH